MTLVTLGYINIFARDVVAIADFYADLFGLEEIRESRTSIFRGLKTKGANLGFNAHGAYALLNLEEYTGGGTKSFLTFDVANAAEVDRLTPIAVAKGATLRKAPFTTYYGWYQSVLLDPERNAFRINFIPA
jgi:predicted enzyme related to lactoylglutathione lyase